MRKYSVAIATMLLLALGMATRADALAISAPAGMRAAIDDGAIREAVGYWGGWGYYDPVVVVRPVVVVPRVVVVPTFYAPVYVRPRPLFYARPFWGGPRFIRRGFYGW
jgi:hypothetical protein